MAPPKVMIGYNKQNNTAYLRKGITTRSQNSLLNNVLFKQTSVIKETRSKRKAEASPPKEKTTKRTAFANITNAIGKTLGETHVPNKLIPQLKTNTENISEKNIVKPTLKQKPAPRVKPTVKKEEKMTRSKPLPKVVNVRQSVDLEKSENSLYISALEDAIDSTKKAPTRNSNKLEIAQIEKEKVEEVKSVEVSLEKSKENKKVIPYIDLPVKKTLPKDVLWDFDAENWLDPFQVSVYAMDIFNYLKEREHLFPVKNYMERQASLSQWMRALLVDWMVEVQESFELNHETLYLAVKLVDLYLSKVTVGKESLQLLGAASLFIASKYDERIPPMVEDFLYICDGAYTQQNLIEMEINILKAANFDLGIPLSYRFLRRYARCAKVSMPTLTLARYILEYSLMDYSMITFNDSKKAAAALLLALQMKDLGGWTPTLEYYSGYKVDDIKYVCNILNQVMHKKHKEALMTVRNKYSHKIFFEVAKLPLKEKLDI